MRKHFRKEIFGKLFLHKHEFTERKIEEKEEK